ncbi:MAG: hypothetical protein LBV51_03930 [Acholeplasmatales bacterium]|jgi:predicted RNA-binding Zn-ribbon protein involved in translation (DUF1610 family)|nr:hypothetical protein [Acholeplasmatales bacterium]
MEKLERQYKKRIIVGIILVIGLLLGIAGMIVGLTNNIVIIWALSIVLIVAGFYGIPICFVFAYSLVDIKNTIILIEGGALDINILSRTVKKKPKTVVSLVSSWITAGYLVGYVFNEDCTSLVKNVKKIEINALKCPSCGKMLNIEVFSECPYCGFIISKTKKL